MTARQDNNGFSHQDPGFIDHFVNKKAQIVPRCRGVNVSICLLAIREKAR